MKINNIRYKAIIALLFSAFVFGSILILSSIYLTIPGKAAPEETARIDPYIYIALEREGSAEVLVVLQEQADLTESEMIEPKELKGQFVYQRLVDVAERSQGPLRTFLETHGTEFRSYWIRNMFLVKLNADLLQELAIFPGIFEINYLHPAYPDVAGYELGPEFGQSLGPPAPDLIGGPSAIEWNILRVNADDVWAIGFQGQGAVVADLDTGVQWDHPALINSYRDPIPGAPTQHDYNWWDGLGGSPVPIDYGSHGTHTMGTVVGDDGGSNQIGMAPGADWIACAGLGGNTNPFDCFQFFLAPTQLDGSNPRPDLAPHVINNSWSSAGTDYHPVIQTLYSAGIYYAKSAGNTGPGCSTITNPGQWPEVTATAAFAQGDTIASFSSRGPVNIGHDVLLKPDIAAPGVNVRSSVPGNGYGLSNGTSMAAPHVTGAVALLISANPDLAGKIDVMQMLLKQNAEPKIDPQCPPYTTHPNCVWGWGILNIYDAVLDAQNIAFGEIEGLVFDSSTMDPIQGAEIIFADNANFWPLYSLSDGGGNYSRNLPTATYNITATHYGYLPGIHTNIVVSDGMTTTQDLPLDPAPSWAVSGTVTEAQTGDPLLADISFEDTPVSTSTDLSTGVYSATVAQGSWWMTVSSPGHAGEDRQITLDQDLIEDFSLVAVENYYMETNDNVCGPSFNWFDATGGSSHCLSDDSAKYVALPVGRSFTFYGNTYNFLYIGSNGHVTFGSPDSKWSGPIPNPATPNNGIYAFSTDLNPATCSQGTIYTDYIDDRYFVIEFLGVQHYPSGDPETFEIILDLDSGMVNIQLLSVSDPNDVVVGVENSSGTEATQYAYDDPALITDNVSVDFYPIFGTPPPTGGSGELSGVVMDGFTGEPLAGAVITATAFTGGEEFTLLTDPSGNYNGSLCADWYDVSAYADGYLPTDEIRTSVISGTQTVQDFYLEMPIAGLSVTNDSPTEIGQVTILSATVAAGYNVEYSWDFGDGEFETGAVLTHTYPSVGEYTAIVTASNEVNTLSTTTLIQIVDVAILGLEIDTDAPTTLGFATNFTATVSAGSNVNFDWEFGDGELATGSVVSHTFTDPGLHEVTVLATNSSSIVSDTVFVEIIPSGWKIYLAYITRH